MKYTLASEYNIKSAMIISVLSFINFASNIFPNLINFLNLFVIKIFFSLFIKSYYSRRKKTRMSDVKFKKFNKDDIDILSKKHNINIELINEEAICVKR